MQSVVSTTKAILAWLRSMIVGQDSVDLPAICRQATAHFEADEAFVYAFFREHFYPRVYTMATQVAASTRVPEVIHEQVVAAVTSEQKTPRLKWGEWLEHSGRRYMRLLSMDKADLLAAAVEREKRGTTELHLAGLWRKLASLLPEGKTVGEHFTEEEIDRWSRTLGVTFTVRAKLPAALEQTQEAAD